MLSVHAPFQFLHFVIFLKILKYTSCEPPSSFYQRPFMPTYPPDDYGPPPAIPSTSYGVPEVYGAPTPSSFYGAPTQSAVYGPPTQASVYGPPAATPAPIIHKHVYVHVPPPEPEYTTPRRPAEVLPAQKHYRIIFIKAPTHPVPTLPPLPAAPENEEKTIVYVLVKKPDDLPSITLTAPASTVPSKPEVYFIRYKTQETTTEVPTSEGGYYKK